VQPGGASGACSSSADPSTLLAEAALSGGSDHVGDAPQDAHAARHSARTTADVAAYSILSRLLNSAVGRRLARAPATRAMQWRRGRAGADEEDGGSNVVTGRGTTVTRRTPVARVRDIRPVFNVLPGQRAAGGAGAGAGIADAPSAAYLASMAALTAVRLVLARSAAACPPAPASFTQTEHVTADQLRDKDVNPAAAVFAFLLNVGAAVGHLMTADVARFDPHDPAAMSADPAALPPAMREYHAWLLSNVCDPDVVHAAQEG